MIEPEPLPDIPPDPDTIAMFPYSVASGDPRSTSVVLWTALDPVLAAAHLEREESDSDPTGGEITLNWELTSLDDPLFETLLLNGSGSTSAEQGFTYKVNVEGLEPDQRYLYRFTVTTSREDQMEDTSVSHIGRTRTLPERADELLLAICSCANFSSGYYHAYRHLSLKEELHVVLHLGDYIYESSGLGDAVRSLSEAFEARDIESYRARYAQYRLDPDLQALHRAHPVIAVWDDHEFDNNASAVGSSSSSGEAWDRRKADAKRVYHEWLPTSITANDPLYRAFSLGGLADLFMLDTRIEGRDPQLIRAEFNRRYEPERQMLGATQEAWLFEGLSMSNAPWKLLGQQVMMSPLLVRGAVEAERDREVALNADQWDGYASARERLYRHIIDESISGVVVCTGDIHTSWAAELSINPNDPLYYQPSAPDEADPVEDIRGGIGVEIVTPGVTSRAFAAITESIIDTLSTANPQFKWFNLTQKGFTELRLSATELEISWKLINSVSEPTLPPLIPAQRLIVRHAPPGKLRLRRPS